jgi:excisionase family DNA binding protein
MSIRQLATYLMVSEKTVYRMVERRQLPSIRVSSQWRFRKDDIDAWLSEQVRHVEMEGGRSVMDEISLAERIRIAPLLEPENAWVRLPAVDRNDVVRRMIRAATLDPHVDRRRLEGAVLEREDLCSTALIDGMAFPHPARPEEFHFTRKRFLVATLAEPVDFADPHGHRPGVVMIILARSLQGHLLSLSRAIKLFGDPGGPAFIARLRASRTPRALLHLITAREARLGSGTADAPPA